MITNNLLTNNSIFEVYNSHGIILHFVIKNTIYQLLFKKSVKTIIWLICFTISSLTWLKISLGEILWRFLYHLPLNSFIAANTRTKISGTLFTCFEFSVTHSYLFKLKFSEMRESLGTTLVQLYENDLLKQLRTEYPLQSRWFYQFLQLSCTMCPIFLGWSVLFSHPCFG